MWASYFKEKQIQPNNDFNRQPNHQSHLISNHSIIDQVILVLKDVLVVANSFLNLHVLDLLINFLTKITERNKPEEREEPIISMR